MEDLSSNSEDEFNDGVRDGYDEDPDPDELHETRGIIVDDMVQMDDQDQSDNDDDNDNQAINDSINQETLAEGDADDNISSSTDTDSENQNQGNETMADDEIDALLDAGLPEGYQGKVKPKEFSVKEIIVLEEKGKNNLEVLPDGWIEIRHLSGLPLYLHRKSRVCTLAKPYCLGPSSVRKHSIPVSAIPCLNYKRALEREKTQYSFTQTSSTPGELNLTESEEESDPQSKQPNKRQKTSGSDEIIPETSTSASTSYSKCPRNRKFPRLPAAKVETAEEANTLFTIQPMELREYCSNLFHFKTVKCKRFTSWNARRRHTKTQKRLRVQRPTLPDGVKLIKFPIKPSGNDASSRTNREYILNPKGKSSVCILHEYVQHALRQQPSYVFRELEHASTPYSATVVINEILYGTGYGSSKKQAKSDAARETLEVLIPEIKGHLDDSTKPNKPGEIDYTEYFDQIGVEDPRITTLCQNISEPTPYALLLTCIQRNYGQSSDSGLNFEMVATVGQVNKFRMTFRDYTVEITAPNKREGKQLASQSLLHKIHPHINNFGAFVRLYGNTSIKSCKEKKQEQQQITTLQSKASSNSPNYAILQKLREEMRKLAEQEEIKQNWIDNDKAVIMVNANANPTPIEAANTNENVPLPNTMNAPNTSISSSSSSSVNNSLILSSENDDSINDNETKSSGSKCPFKNKILGTMDTVTIDSAEDGELSEGSQEG